MRSTMNSGVCISDPNFEDYYGRIKEIIQVEYREAPLKQIVLFKCEWFDPIIDGSVKKHDRYKLVDINHRRRYKKYESFILAMQATQVCYVPYPSKKKDKEDWLAVLKVKPRNVIELPVEEVVITSELNVPFQVEEVEVHEIDMFVSVDKDILLHDPNGGVFEMNEPLNDGLFIEHHEIQDGCTEEEYETEKTEEEDEEEEFEENIDNMTRGGYRAGKSTGRSKAANRAKIPSIPASVIEQDDTSSIPTMPPDQTPNMNAQSNTAAEAIFSQRNVSASGDSSCNNGRTLIFLTSSGSITLSFKSEVDPNGINWKGVSQDVKDDYFREFNKNFYWDASVSEVLVKQQWMKKVALYYKNFISNIKKHRATVQPKFVNDHVWEKWMELWQSDDCVKKFEINSKNHCGGHEVAVGTHTGGSSTAGEHRKKLVTAAGFMLLFQQVAIFQNCNILPKKPIVTVFQNCSNSAAGFMLFFQQAIAAVSLVFSFCRDPTSSELHLHVHTHNNDGKSFVGERFRLLHERYEEIIRKKVQCESEIDQLETYYEIAGGAKKKILFGLGSEATSYFEKNLCACNTSTSSVPPSISLPTTNMKELVKQLIPALTTHFLPIVIERVGGTRVQDGAVLDPPPTHDDDDEVDS
ncbi:hypothetical protein P3S68_010789 [Capsicum galapagoense]